MMLLLVDSTWEFAKGWYYIETGAEESPEYFLYEDRGNGPEIKNSGVHGPYESKLEAFTTNLADILIEKFGNWPAEGSGELLEDIGTVKDHLADDFDRWLVDQVDDVTWKDAWTAFDEVAKEHENEWILTRAHRRERGQ